MELGILVRPVIETYNRESGKYYHRSSYDRTIDTYNDSQFCAILKRATDASEFRLLRERSPHTIDSIISFLKKQENPQIEFVHGVVFINKEGDDYVWSERPHPEGAECRAAGLWYPTLGIIEEINTTEFYQGSRTWQEDNVRVTDAIETAHDAWLRLLAFVAYPIVALESKLKDPPLSIRTAERALQIADKQHILYKDTHDYGFDLIKDLIRLRMAGKTDLSL